MNDTIEQLHRAHETALFDLTLDWQRAAIEYYSILRRIHERDNAPPFEPEPENSYHGGTHKPLYGTHTGGSDAGATRMPFGQYKGRTLDSIHEENESYLPWLQSQGTLRDPLKSKLDSFLQTYNR